MEEKISPKIKEPPSDNVRGINNSWFRRNLILASVSLLRRLRPSRGGVLMLTSSICVKYGPSRHLSEAKAMLFVADHTSIPVPRIFCAFQKNGITYIAMERIKGDSIRKRWPSISGEAQAYLLFQLKDFVTQLRAIPPPRPGEIGGADYSQLFDDRIQAAGFGPFHDSKEFHKFLRKDLTKSVDDPELHHLVTAHESKEYPTCFTHGDLSTFNILVRDGEIAGIIDWEMAGWYPDYWEYTSAWHVNPYDEGWKSEVSRFLDPYPTELEMEMLRRKIFPMF